MGHAHDLYSTKTWTCLLVNEWNLPLAKHNVYCPISHHLSNVWLKFSNKNWKPSGNWYFSMQSAFECAEGISVEADDWNLPFTESIINHAISHWLIKLMAISK